MLDPLQDTRPTTKIVRNWTETFCSLYYAGQEASDAASINNRLMEKVTYTTVVDRANSSNPMYWNFLGF